MSDNNLETELHMGCYSLGAVSSCGGWPNAWFPRGRAAGGGADVGGRPRRLLKGSHGDEEVQPQLIEPMKKAGSTRSWQLPVFFCDELRVRNSWRTLGAIRAILLTHQFLVLRASIVPIFPT